MSVIIYATGLCYCSACAPKTLTAEEVQTEVQAANPARTSRGWQISADSRFRIGQANPCECEDDSTRQHWLLDC